MVNNGASSKKVDAVTSRISRATDPGVVEATPVGVEAVCRVDKVSDKTDPSAKGVVTMMVRLTLVIVVFIIH
jgi:hypothetical protein